MVIGLILVGSGIGAFGRRPWWRTILGQSAWMALLIYAALGVLGALAGAAILAVRAGVRLREKFRQALRLAQPTAGLILQGPGSSSLPA